ncbi:MAG: hypothetical protein LBO09_02925 [Candidatus Peribacteria bacterium]|nr:hypothetical protein [Candidatus Peribacteria bacterium]
MVVCGKLVSCSEVEDANARAVLNDDVNEFVGIENSSMCEFGCELGYESSGYGFISREIYRFSSLDLGIRFTYEASRITEDGEVSPKMTIIHTGNLVCLRRDDELERKDKM